MIMIGPPIKHLGAWLARSNNTVYQAATDGFVCAFKTGTGTGGIAGFTDGSNPPTVVKGVNSSTNLAEGGMGISTMPVKKNDYWKVTGSTVVWWIPELP